MGETMRIACTQNLEYELQLPPVYEGRLSNVYCAQDLHMNRMVAIKEVLLQGLSHKDQQTLKSEISRCCECGTWGDHVPQIYTQFEQNDCLYLVMQWIQGKTLEHVLKEDHLNFAEKLDLAMQICNVVAPMHRNKVQHRDLKPANLQVDSWRRVWLMDFNITAAVPHQGIGSGIYMAPEQAGYSCQAGSGRVDVFAIGVILYEMFTGVAPIIGINYSGDPQDSKWQYFEAPSTKDPQLPQELDNIIIQCMRLNWKERYADAGQILGALKRLRGARKTWETRATPSYQTRRR